MVTHPLDLWDYRRRVSEAYAAVRASGAGVEVWRRWIAHRDELFATHPQSPVEDRESFRGLPYFGYDPNWRTVGRFSPSEEEQLDVPHSASGATPFRRLGTVRFEAMGQHGELSIFWLDTYGGGVFLPFRDATNGDTTYGGGRYLLDTAKGADLGHDGDQVVLDFNFAYQPSCVHSDRWSCPLAPPENRLEFAVPAGECLDGPG